MNPGDSPTGSPWKGLAFYTEEDQDLFFGRSRESEEFVRLVQRDILTVLFARSGLGKSSLLRAGVAPLLRKQNFLPVLVRVDYAASSLRPVDQIVAATFSSAAVAKIEVEAADGYGSPATPAEWLGTLWEFFHCHQFWSPRNDPVQPVLILDQFEEVFTLGQRSSHTAGFIEQLADLAENRMPQSVQSRLETTGERLTFDTRTQDYKVILALREDYVPKLDSLRPIMPAVMHNRYELTLLDKDRALEVVRKAGGQWVSDAVARDIVTAVAGEDQSPEPGTPEQLAAREVEPAYLSVMCDELFRRMVDQRKSAIDSSLVRAEQGNILDTLYERSFTGLDPATRVFVEDRLLTPGGFRGSMPLAETEGEGIARSDLESLVKSRLLRMEDRLKTTHIEISHDLLAPIVRKSRDARRDKAKAEEEREVERRRAAEFATKLRRERRRLGVAVAVVVLLVGGIALFLFGWVLPHDTYCRNFTKRWGTVYPVGVLPASAVAHRAWSLRVTSDGWFGKVRTAAFIDANHRLTSKAPVTTYLSDSDEGAGPSGQFVRSEFVYDKEGRIVYEVAYNQADRMVLGFVYVPDEETGTTKKPTELLQMVSRLFNVLGGKSDGRPPPAKAMYVGADGYPKPQGSSRAEFVQFGYDERGFESELSYKDRNGRLTPGPDKAYGQRKVFDAEGRLVRLTSLNRDGEPMNDEAGNAGMEAKYDEDGNVIEGRAFDAKGEPTLVKDGWHRTTSHYDQWGRVTETRFFNLSEEAIEETKETGAHRVTWDYDDSGNAKSTKLYGKANEAVVAGTGIFDFAAHERRVTFNSDNRAETVAYFDGNGKALIGPEGWHRARREYDDQGFVSAITYFDKMDKAVNLKTTGIHRWQGVNDAFGQPTQERFYGVDGRPVATRDGGYHLRRNEYDLAGNLTAQAYFDLNNKPVLDRTYGAHRIVWDFDRFKHPVLAQYFDAGGQPIDNKQGFHKAESTYDRNGSHRGTRWYDKDGQPTRGPDGAHELRNTYDERGLLQRSAYYDAKSRPVTNRQGIHEAILEHNAKRQETKKQFFGLNRKPAEDKDGNYLKLTEYDERGRIQMAAALRADGGPNVDRELGIAKIAVVYDKEGRLQEGAYYDAANRPVVGPGGFAEKRLVKEPDGRIALIHYGADHKPTFNPLQGFAIKKTDSRTQGDTVDSYHGPDGNLISGPEGYAEVRSRWGEDGKLLSQAYFGPDGMPVAGPGGFHRAEQTAGTTARYFAADGRELAPGPETVAGVIVLSEIPNVKQPAYKAGLQVGDILWRYGDWSYPEALAAERAKGTQPDAIFQTLMQKFFAERDRLSGGSTRMTVIRYGTPIQLTVPPLPDKVLGARLAHRVVPLATFEAWRKVRIQK